MKERVKSFLAEHSSSCRELALIGGGRFGRLVKECASELGIHVMVYDPPLADAQSDAVCEAFLPQWGNGMGGCDFSRDAESDDEVYYSFSLLCERADIISVHVPLTESGAYPTRGMISKDFLSSFAKDGIRVLLFSDDAVMASDVPEGIAVRFS